SLGASGLSHGAGGASLGSSRGGGASGSGLSFGSGGISIGGFSFGTGSRGNSSTDFNFNPSHDRYPGNRDGGMQIIPQVDYVPPIRVPGGSSVYVPQPNWTNTQPTFQPPVQTAQPVTPQVQPNELPAEMPSDPIVTDPKPNSGILIGRQITEAEVERAREFFHAELLDLAKVLQKRLPPVEYDPDVVTALMIEHALSVTLQIQILGALEGGEYDKAQEIWVANLPGVDMPFHRSRIWLLFIRFHVMIERRSIDYRVVGELLQSLPPEVLRPSLCCGADDLLVQIQEQIHIDEAIGGSSVQVTTAGGEPESFSKPRPNDTPFTYTSTEKMTGDFSKPDGLGKPGAAARFEPYGEPGRPVSLPTGPVNLVYHPRLPDRQVVVVNAQTVMIGTGGRGSFKMDRGYVAEALGLKIGRGTPLAENRSELVRLGVVLINPTQSKVRFVFGSHDVVLEPAFLQTFPGAGVISFDRGAGKQTARYTLEAGTYEFAAGAEGWDLNSKSYEVTVSNAAGLEPFHYIVQGEEVSLAADESRTHTSKYPILIRFDRGDGATVRQVRWEKGPATLQVAVNPSDNLWDLFVSDGAGEQEASLEPTPDFKPAF
ncbi:MAG: hypothetical protein ACYC6Y_01315, partial [Thermoguttaceae bacterium]